ncbi:divergent polysaccharide deacetylase family protein [Paenibacillus sp. y28]|uniref:divergent polysaccharide deacetylase family protein n=1 Tax=Paenibacillus sp. y28 TaxID=3129110 RepID=UPI00301B22A7
MRTRRLLLCAVLLAFLWSGSGLVAQPVQAVQAPEENQEQQSLPAKRLAIVIDDFGNDMQGTKEMMELPVPLTVAVMPFLPTSRRDAEWAHRVGHEVIVHLPMEPMKGKRSWLGPQAITTDLSDDEIRRRVLGAIEEVPYAVGMNNHMGSKATADPRVMRLVLEVCKEKGLFYLDSRTTEKSVVASVSRELGVPYIENELFFDSQYTTAHVQKQMRKLKQFITDHDRAVIIGHVGPPGKITSAAILQEAEALSKLAKLGHVSELIKTAASQKEANTR